MVFDVALHGVCLFCLIFRFCIYQVFYFIVVVILFPLTCVWLPFYIFFFVFFPLSLSYLCFYFAYYLRCVRCYCCYSTFVLFFFFLSYLPLCTTWRMNNLKFYWKIINCKACDFFFFCYMMSLVRWYFLNGKNLEKK